MTEVNVKLHSKTDSKFSQWTKELERLARVGLEQEIAQHKANGRAIFYSENGVSIMELADGRCFEYRLLEDGTRKITCEISRR